MTIAIASSTSRSVFALAAAVILTALGASHARSQGLLVPNGAADAPLRLTLDAPVFGAASGPNLVTNPGFETGFTGYDVSTATYGSNVSVNQNDPHGGRYAAQFSDTDKGSYDTVSQILNTTPGVSYTIKFYLANSYNNVGGNGFKAGFGNSLLLNQGTSSTFGYTLFTYTATATDPFTNLYFEGNNASGFYALDDISVNAVLPEPGSWVGCALLFGAGSVALRYRRVLPPSRG